jgi:hypothetical protein
MQQFAKAQENDLLGRDMKREIKELSDEVIQELFGSEAAEDEDPERLKQYYFKSDIYRSMTASLPLKIIVGHKGIGKSALITIAIQEDMEHGTVPVLIQPNDISALALGSTEFLKLINEWTSGLNEIIARKALQSLGLADSDDALSLLKKYGGKVVSFVIDTARPLVAGRVDLSQTQSLLAKNLFASQSINVYLDDLDRGWQGRKEDITRISALLNAVRDISNENRNIRFKIALRSDVYFLVRTSDESTDKTEGAVVWYSWTNHEILALLAKRIETFFGRQANEATLIAKRQSQLARYLDPVMEARFKGKGKWSDVPIHQVLMSLIRKRPRDLVKLCTLAAKSAQKRKAIRIETEDFQAIFEEYSQGRVQDTINEYRSELPAIERLIMGMKPARKEKQASVGYVYTTDALIKKLSSISEQGRFVFQDKEIKNERELAHFLYKINFLTARKDLPAGEILRKYFEENRYLSGKFADFGFIWEVHPAYRWALQPDDLASIFEQLEPTADEEER